MIVRKFNFSILSTLYANLTRVVNKRKASLLGLEWGESPLAGSPMDRPTCNLIQHLVLLNSFKSYSRTRTSRNFFAPYTSKLMRHSPSGKHPYLAVRFRGKPNQAIQEMQFNVLPTDYSLISTNLHLVAMTNHIFAFPPIVATMFSLNHHQQ